MKTAELKDVMNFLEKHGIGSGTNITTNLMAGMMVEFSKEYHSQFALTKEKIIGILDILKKEHDEYREGESRNRTTNETLSHYCCGKAVGLQVGINYLNELLALSPVESGKEEDDNRKKEITDLTKRLIEQNADKIVGNIATKYKQVIAILEGKEQPDIPIKLIKDGLSGLRVLRKLLQCTGLQEGEKVADEMTEEFEDYLKSQSEQPIITDEEIELKAEELSTHGDGGIDLISKRNCITMAKWARDGKIPAKE